MMRRLALGEHLQARISLVMLHSWKHPVVHQGQKTYPIESHRLFLFRGVAWQYAPVGSPELKQFLLAQVFYVFLSLPKPVATASGEYDLSPVMPGLVQWMQYFFLKPNEAVLIYLSRR